MRAGSCISNRLKIKSSIILLMITKICYSSQKYGLKLKHFNNLDCKTIPNSKKTASKN